MLPILFLSYELEQDHLVDMQVWILYRFSLSHTILSDWLHFHININFNAWFKKKVLVHNKHFWYSRFKDKRTQEMDVGIR